MDMRAKLAQFCGVPALTERQKRGFKTIDWDVMGPKIRELAQTMCVKRIADALNLDDKTVSRYCITNKIETTPSKYRSNQAPRDKWTEEEDAYLIANADMPSDELVKALGRSYKGIKNRACHLRKMGIDVPYMHQWTPKELRILECNIDLTLNELSRLLPGRTKKAIANKRKEVCREESQE